MKGFINEGISMVSSAHMFSMCSVLLRVCCVSRLGRELRILPHGAEKYGHDQLEEVSEQKQRRHVVFASCTRLCGLAPLSRFPRSLLPKEREEVVKFSSAGVHVALRLSAVRARC